MASVQWALDDREDLLSNTGVAWQHLVRLDMKSRVRWTKVNDEKDSESSHRSTRHVKRANEE